MTSNQDEARKVIERALIGKNFLQGASDAAQALADAGLLMPDLPEPKRYPDGFLEWNTTSGLVELIPGEPLRVALESIPEEPLIDKPEDVVNLALSLLSAADHMERNL